MICSPEKNDPAMHAERLANRKSSFCDGGVFFLFCYIPSSDIISNRSTCAAEFNHFTDVHLTWIFSVYGRQSSAKISVF